MRAKKQPEQRSNEEQPAQEISREDWVLRAVAVAAMTRYFVRESVNSTEFAHRKLK